MSSAGRGPARIVHLLRTLDPGGVERSVLDLATHLDRDRYDSRVWYMTGRGSLSGAFRARGIPTRRIPLLFSTDLSIVPRLTLALRGERTDILHTHHPEATAFGRLASPHAGLKALVTTEHTVTHWSHPGRFINRLVRATAHRAQAVVSVSRAVEYLSKGAGAALPGRSRIIRDGVSLPDGTPPGSGPPPAASPERKRAARRRFGIPEEGPLVATLGRLETHKGLATFLDMIPLVLSERADALFAIAGEGPERGRLLARSGQLEIADRLIFTGVIMDPHDFLPAVDVFVLPSLTEGYGLAGLEAMAHGIPVVGAHAGGIPELLEAGGGLEVGAASPRETAAVVLYLLNSALYRAEIGEAGRRRVLPGAPGSAARMAAEYAALYDELPGGLAN